MDCRSAQNDFNLLIAKLPTSVLSNFVVWVDLKIAEYKVFGRILSDAERPEKNEWTQLSISALRQQIQPDNLERTGNKHDKTTSFKTSSAETVKQKYNKTSNSTHQSYKAQNNVSETDGSEIINLDSDDDEDQDYKPQKGVSNDSHRRRASLDHPNKQGHNESLNLNIKIEPDDDIRPHVEAEIDTLDGQSVHVQHKNVPDTGQISDSENGYHGDMDISEVKEIKLEVQNAYHDKEKSRDKFRNNFPSQRFMSKGQTQHFMRKDQGQHFRNKGQGHLASSRQNIHNSDKPFVEEIQSRHFSDLSENEIHIGNTMHLLQNLEEVSAISDDNHDNTFSSLTLSPSQNDTYFEGNQEISLSKLVEHQSDLDYQHHRDASFSRLSEQGQGQNDGDVESNSGNHGGRSVNVDRFDIQFPESDASSLKMCNICFTIFSNIRELQRHFNMCHPGDSLTPGCVFCGNTFPNDSILKRHIACDHIGSNIGFHCIFCGKEFSQAQHFQGHLNQHRGVQPFKCKRCGKSFTYKTHLTCHMRHCGGINGKYKCNLCHRVFLERGHLTEHMHGMHNSGNPRYKCQFCGEKFVWRGSLVRHKKLKCPSNPARQQNCDNNNLT